MESLGFYPVTVVLSFLSECDGTSLLLTKKVFAKRYLSLFRLRNDEIKNDTDDPKHRYRFHVSPVQGHVVLLQRLNTRRLCKRRNTREQPCYLQGLTTTELANLEWEQSQRTTFKPFPYPPPLELLRFLDQRQKKYCPLDIFANCGTTLILSYPRSGNTLLRTLIERTTGLVTGCDTRPDRSLSKALAEAHNLVGEGVTQKSKTCFVKSHWPERIGCNIFQANRAILIVRNPYDVIDSYWNLNATNTHTETVTDEIYEQFHDVFDGLVRNEIGVWCKFHRFWLDTNQCDNFPLLLVRFEDLIQRPEAEMTRILQFAANTKVLDDFWCRRISHATVTSSKKDSLGSYSPRSATTGVKSIGKSIRKGRYSQEILDYISAYAAASCDLPEDNLLLQFGYDMKELNFPENFVKGTEPGLPPRGSWKESSGFVRVNSGYFLVRPRDCPFGRAMRTWRLENTKNDSVPFPRVPR